MYTNDTKKSQNCIVYIYLFEGGVGAPGKKIKLRGPGPGGS